MITFYAPVNTTPCSPNRGGVGDLAGKVVTFDCKCVALVIGDFNDIFSFGRDAGTKAGEWI